MDEYGTTLLIIEIVVLAVATFGAVTVDHFHGAQQRKKQHKKTNEETHNAEAPSL